MSEVVVWSWSLDDRRLQADGAEAVLSKTEWARARRFVDARHRQRFVASRIGLRGILGAHTGHEPSPLAFAENEFGKPHLVGFPSLNFSLSHSDDQAVLAIREGAAIGIDIERVRALEHDEIAARYFCASEAAWIDARPSEEERRTAFFQTWTLKEAVVKALGMGMSMPLSEFEVSAGDTPPRLVVPAPGASLDWQLRLLTAPTGYLCALAAPGASEVVVTQRTY
ncbi:MAG: 4'-phosphopantetheinyl transferase family protein [Vitreimonas sp.]